jgi:hypothetical protein
MSVKSKVGQFIYRLVGVHLPSSSDKYFGGGAGVFATFVRS